MNHSIYSADRGTHLKIVMIAVCAVIAVLCVGLSSRDTKSVGYTQTAHVTKPGKPVMVTDSVAAVVR